MTGRKRDFTRLFHPRHIAVIGGGAWCEQVIIQAQRAGFQGQIWPVHPHRKSIAGLPAFASADDLPAAPDASFVGINRRATIDTIQRLSDMNAGGAVCFASGFSEAMAEDTGGDALQQHLLNAASDMPIIGPNCYGFINALDGAILWPDQHGLTPVEQGVAILTQSSNIAINLSMQKRALPIAFLVACGNMAQTSQAELAHSLLNDPRISAIGVHIEGFSDLRQWEALAKAAHAKQVPIIALKVGRSDHAQAATLSHTASLAGSDAGAAALLDRLGIARVSSLPAFVETLKLAHVCGPLQSRNIASVSCSGGEASLVADLAVAHNITFPPLAPPQETALRSTLGPMVALANPLDYHTYIWRDTAAMARCWAAMVTPAVDLTMAIVDYPRDDLCDAADWQCATDAALAVRAKATANFALVASLPELMPEHIARVLLQGGVAPLCGIDEALCAVAACATLSAPATTPLLLPTTSDAAPAANLLTEAQAKTQLAAFGLDVPRRKTGSNPGELACGLHFPVVLKGQGFAHKTEAGAVALGLMSPAAITDAARDMPTDSFLVEEMVVGGVADLLVGVVRDPAHGFVLTLAAGGVLTELISDRVSMLVPVGRATLKQALTQLKVHKMLVGYRGASAANIAAILDAIEAVQSYVLANSARLAEIEINPLICTPTRAVAVDALIREADRPDVKPS